MLTAAKFFSQFWSFLCYSQHHDNYHMITVVIHWTKFKLADHAWVINATKRCMEHVQCQKYKLRFRVCNSKCDQTVV